MEGNHCGHCSITHNPVDPLTPLVLMINCQLSPGGLNWQVNQTDYLLGGICKTDDDAPSSLLSALILLFQNHCMKISCSAPLSHYYPSASAFGVKACAARKATSVWGWGSARQGGHLAGHDSETPQRNSPLASPCVFSPRPSSVKSDMWSGTCDVGGVGGSSRQEALAGGWVEPCVFISVNPPT